MSLLITACIITKNEESNIVRCLESLSFCSEIILVDSGSTDRTLELANRFGVKIFHRDFDNYIAQKNYAISLASNAWILSVDADEVVSPDLRSEIEALDFDSDLIQAYSMPRLSFYLGRWIYHGGWYPNTQTRLFHKSSGKFSGILVHETVEISGKTEALKSPLHHYSYKSISDHLNFIDRYSTLFALENYRKGRRATVFKACYKGLYKFFWMYLGRLGFLDGQIGIVIAILGSYYNFLKYLKLYELEKNPSLASSFLVMIDPIHHIESQESSQKDSNQVDVR
jgi:glycosyltransferase involved in cell wall biosynthesis